MPATSNSSSRTPIINLFLVFFWSAISHKVEYYFANVEKNEEKTPVYFGNKKKGCIFAPDLAKHLDQEAWVSG